MSHFFLIPTLKEFKKGPTFAKVTVKIKVAQFFGLTLYMTAYTLSIVTFALGRTIEPQHNVIDDDDDDAALYQ